MAPSAGAVQRYQIDCRAPHEVVQVRRELAPAGPDVDDDGGQLVVGALPDPQEGVGEHRSRRPVGRGGEVLRRTTAGDVETTPGGIQGVLPGHPPRSRIHDDGL